METHADDIPDDHPHAPNMVDVPADVTPTRWWLWVSEISHGASQLEIAAKAGIDNSHISRWKRGYQPSVQFVTKMARAYGVSTLRALVEAEMISEQEADIHTEVIASFSEATNEQLIEELQRRLLRGGD